MAPIWLQWQVDQIGARRCTVGIHGMVSTVGVGTLVSTDGCRVEQFLQLRGDYDDGGEVFRNAPFASRWWRVP